MKIKIANELTLYQLRRCLAEEIYGIEETYAVRHAKSVNLYMTMTNGFGHEVDCIAEDGRAIRTVLTNGPYVAAADQYKV